MLPRIIKEKVTQITIAMPFLSYIPEDRFNLEKWRALYEEETKANKILYYAKKYNAYIIDIGIMWHDEEFYFEMCFASILDLKNFKKDVLELLS